MPCNSDYMNPTTKERDLSRVACLLDELDGKLINNLHWNGYHPLVYCKNVDGDVMVSTLCSRLQVIDVSTKSLEMQIWWRDHLAADKARIESEMAKQKTKEERDSALEKLTEHERKILGL